MPMIPRVGFRLAVAEPAGVAGLPPRTALGRAAAPEALPMCHTASKPLAESNTAPGFELSAAPALPQCMRKFWVWLLAYTVSRSTQTAAMRLAASQVSIECCRRVVL